VFRSLARAFSVHEETLRDPESTDTELSDAKSPADEKGTPDAEVAENYEQRRVGRWNCDQYRKLWKADQCQTTRSKGRTHAQGQSEAPQLESRYP